MTTTTKTVTAIVVLIVLALIALYAYQTGQLTGRDSTSEEVVLPSGTDTSDAGLNEDTAAIDASLSDLESDQAEVDAGLEGHVAP